MITDVTIIKALAHPLRLDIIKLIASTEESLCVCKIQEHFSVGQSSLSQHLKILKEAELVESRKSGGWVYYNLKNIKINQLLNIIKEIQ